MKIPSSLFSFPHKVCSHAAPRQAIPPDHYTTPGAMALGLGLGVTVPVQFSDIVPPPDSLGITPFTPAAAQGPPSERKEEEKKQGVQKGRRGERQPGLSEHLMKELQVLYLEGLQLASSHPPTSRRPQQHLQVWWESTTDRLLRGKGCPPPT